jgi:uncharacterized surface protein with fasciclin (FAS1) repeats
MKNNFVKLYSFVFVTSMLVGLFSSVNIKAANIIEQSCSVLYTPYCLDISADISPDNTISKYLSTQPKFSIFIGLLEDAGLLDMINDNPDNYIVLAPENDAFVRYFETLDNKVVAFNQDRLTQILKKHIIPAGYDILLQPEGVEYTTLGGTKVSVSRYQDMFSILSSDGVVSSSWFGNSVKDGVVYSMNTVIDPLGLE